MFQFDRKNLIALAKLCRVHCLEEEVDELVPKLQSVLDLVSELEEIDTKGVPPCNYVHDITETTMREDDPKETIDRKIFLDNSPSHVGGMIRVPPVIKF